MSKILVVDDSGYARRVHRSILESAGHTVLEASTGMTAIESYSIEKPDLVLLDLSMADLGGLDVLKTLCEIDDKARVIVLSADVQRTTEEAAMTAGARRFLSKPANAEQLVRTVTAVVGEVR
jgi:two-component system, chemotaxis family, chemotaxis protein CheY